MQLLLENLACERGGRRLFSGLSQRIGAGQSLLVKGPNGAGKTTLLKTIAGLLAPALGTITLNGGDPEATLAEQAHLVGHLSGVKRALSVRENYDFWRAYLANGEVENGLERLGLSGLDDLPAGVLSAGQRRRLALSRLYAAPRPLWLLDEPAEALDQSSKRLLAGMLADHANSGGIALVVSHISLGHKFTRTLDLGSASKARKAAK